MQATAAKLDITADEYEEIETGKMLITYEQAMQLGKLFKIKGKYFYEAALQLDVLLGKIEIIKIQKEKIEELKRQLPIPELNN
jgi:plasmid maintenance system antidote protein VapI